MWADVKANIEVDQGAAPATNDLWEMYEASLS